MREHIVGIVLVMVAMNVVAADLVAPALIPMPQKIEKRDGAFELGPETRIRADSAAREAGQYLAERLRRGTGFPLNLSTTSKAQVNKGEILLTTKGATGLQPEGYELNVAPDSVVIWAADPAGLFYGVQTFLQLLPPEVFAAQPVRTRD